MEIRELTAAEVVALRELLCGNGAPQGRTVRVAWDGDGFKVKVGEGMWTAPLGRPELREVPMSTVLYAPFDAGAAEEEAWSESTGTRWRRWDRFILAGAGNGAMYAAPNVPTARAAFAQAVLYGTAQVTR